MKSDQPGLTKFMTSISARSSNEPVAFRRQGGFNLLEVLIALVVLAIGLLGLAALQNFSLQFNTQSYQRTQAIMLVDEMIERMRANPAGLFAVNYILPLTDVPPGSPDCQLVSCTNSADMANYDMAQWIRAMKAPANQAPVLINPRGAISRAPVGPAGAPLYTVSITWSEQQQDLTHSVTVQLQ